MKSRPARGKPRRCAAAFFVSTRQVRRERRSWAQRHPGRRPLTKDERTLVWLHSLDPRAIDHISVYPHVYVSIFGQRANRAEMTLPQFARSLHPAGGVLKRISNVNLEACYLVLPPDDVQ